MSDVRDKQLATNSVFSMLLPKIVRRSGVNVFQEKVDVIVRIACSAPTNEKSPQSRILNLSGAGYLGLCLFTGVIPRNACLVLGYQDSF